MLEIFKKRVPDFDSIEKTILITHADVDHCGLLSVFDKIITSRKTAKCLENEYNGKNGYREQNPLHKPYINICKLLTEYEPVKTEKLYSPWKSSAGDSPCSSRICIARLTEVKSSLLTSSESPIVWDKPIT